MRGWKARLGWTASLLLATTTKLTRAAYTLDINSTDSIKSVASQLAADLVSMYDGDKPGKTPGLLPPPYYWWEGGAFMGSLIDYWYYTGDSKYNDIITQGMLHQVGPNRDYMEPNQTMTEGNDDQGFWGMAAMTAAEYNFKDPAPDQPQWLALAQAVFNTQAARWDTRDCGGGLRWQIFTWNNGIDYKNSISQACFFNIAARLALYTGNSSYADWAEKTWDWMIAVKFIDSTTYYVYDGGHTGDNCTKLVPYQFSYNPGAMLLGATAMYNHSTGAARELWRERVDGLLNGTMVFFTGDKNNIMTEVACEPVNLCDLDQQSFKAYLSRWMAATTKWAPWTHDRIMPLLRSSAVAAVSQCKGGDNGRMCGLRWTDNGKWDGTTGFGQQMAAMEVLLANLIKNSVTPVTGTTGGTSQGDPGAGGPDVGRTDPFNILEMMGPITDKDRAGAYIVTIVMMLSLIACFIFICKDETSGSTLRLADMKYLFAAGPIAGAHLRKKSAAAAKGETIERSDSDRSTRFPSVIERGAFTSHDPAFDEPHHNDPRAYAPGHRSVVSDPGIEPSGVPGAGFKQTAERQLSHGRSQSMTAAKRNSLKKKAPPNRSSYA